MFNAIAKPLASLLAFFYGLIPSYGIAIVLLTLAIMLLLTPLTVKSTRSMLAIFSRRRLPNPPPKHWNASLPLTRAEQHRSIALLARQCRGLGRNMRGGSSGSR